MESMFVMIVIKNIQGQKMNNIVNHNFRYHAEIKYETENGFGYTKAVGSTINDFLGDLKLVLNRYIKNNRDPKVVEIIDMKYFKKK